MPETDVIAEGALLYEPPAERQKQSRLAAYQRFVEKDLGRSFADYAALWDWSTRDIDGFWRSIWRFFDVQSHAAPSAALVGAMPEARWFPGALLNYTEHALRRRDDHPALIARAEDGAREELSYAELASRVARARAGLLRLGVGRGDRVAALLPNGVEAVVAFLATASLGAIWSSCSPEFGVTSVLDRFRQIEPKLLIAVDAYAYGGKTFDRSAALTEVVSALPSLQHTVVVSRSGLARLPTPSLSFDELLSQAAPLTFEPVPFEHPLWVLYSSGTTGLPKPIVHGHGGILLEHYKALALHCDLQPSDRFFWFTTTGWMMWNFLVGGLLLGTTLVLYDGSPAHPDLSALFRVAAEERISYFGTSAPFLMACRKAGLEPGAAFDLGALRSVGSTGAPLPPEGFAWVYDHVQRDLLLGSVSGGTDVCTAFVLSAPTLPVRAGELSCRGLGCKVEAFDAAGRPVIDEVGELVLTAPMPSMPVGFWGDADGSRYRDSYFSTYPGVWRHGDWIRITPRGSAVIYGRSDATLNRGGVRMGTSEFYRVVEALPEVADSLVVDTAGPGNETGTLWLFLVLRPGHSLDAPLLDGIRKRLRSDLSPRHVPDRIEQVTGVPRTLNGKKLEVPIKRILCGVPAEKAVNVDTVQNPDALQSVLRAAGHAGV